MNGIIIFSSDVPFPDQETTGNISLSLPSDYIEFHVGNAVNIYGPPIISAVGTVGNVLSLMVATQKQNRRSSPSWYIGSLAILDTIMLLVGLLQYWFLFNFFSSLITKAHCHAMFFVVNFFSNWSVWTILAMTLERFIVVVFPLKAAVLCSVGKTKTVILAISLVSALKNFHYIWTADFVFNSSTKAALCAFGLVRRGTWVIAIQWLDTCVSSVLPFLIILGANFWIITIINRQRASRKTMTHSDPSNKASSSADTSITAMLVTVSLSFVILTCPLFIFRTYFTFVARNTAYLKAVYHLGHHICHKVWYMNNAVNFYLYCITGRRFRSDLMEMFKSGNGGGQSKISTSNSMSTSASSNMA